MVILGLILVLVAPALGAALLMGTSAPEVSGQDVDIRLFDTVTINLNPLTPVIVGMLTMLLLWLGLVLIKWALTRKARARRLRKEQAAEAREAGRGSRPSTGEEIARRERDPEDQRTSTEIARERAEAAERHDPTLAEQRTQRIDTGAGGDTRPVRRDGVADDATRPLRREGDTRL
ncbi:hypothetical protein LP422_17235 [Janibacter limosus]|uniref:hypothetical protein n=1 Tax=Janibacter limosus TaxID=53458 RepID=UPI0035E2FA84|nr:hypothetical protein LP422_17235 [Janibacter limosus]